MEIAPSVCRFLPGCSCRRLVRRGRRQRLQHDVRKARRRVLGVSAECPTRVRALRVGESREQAAIARNGDLVADFDDSNGVGHAHGKSWELARGEKPLVTGVSRVLLGKQPSGRLEGQRIKPLVRRVIPDHPADFPWVRRPGGAVPSWRRVRTRSVATKSRYQAFVKTSAAWVSCGLRAVPGDNVITCWLPEPRVAMLP